MGIIGAMLTYTPAELRAMIASTRPRRVFLARYCLRLVLGGQLGNVIAGQCHCLDDQLFT